MAAINIKHFDENYVQIVAERSQLLEMKESFSFFAAGYQFNPKYKSGYWDGRISLINFKEGNRIRKGLIPSILNFCNQREYQLIVDDGVLDGYGKFNVTSEQVIQMYGKLNSPYKPHRSQVDTVTHCINNDRSIILAPPNNGKSYAIHGISSFYAKAGLRVLVVIDRIQLVNQLCANMETEYRGNLNFSYGNVYNINTPDVKVDVYFTTWQSCYNNQQKWFRQFDVIIGDEVHKFAADSLRKLFDKCGHIKYRHGLTGTLSNDSKINELELTGMFGEPQRVSTTQQDIEDGISSKPVIHAILRKYSPSLIKKIYQKHGVKNQYNNLALPFRNEIQFLESDSERNRFICKLDQSLKGNNLIAFRRADHGQLIVDKIRQSQPEKPVMLIHHKVKITEREKFADIIRQSKNSTAVASVGTSSYGLNIKNLNNIICACQIKGSIDVIQLLGRGIRIDDGKNSFNMYDIGDDLTYNGKENVTLNHFKTRLEIYAKEGHEIRLIQYQVKEN